MWTPIFAAVAVLAIALAVYARLRLVRERRRTEQEQAVNERLREVDRLTDKFLDDASHELRTPLFGILGLTESLTSGDFGELPDTVRQDLEAMRAAAERLQKVVEAFSGFSGHRFDPESVREAARALEALRTAPDTPPVEVPEALARSRKAGVLVVDDEPLNLVVLSAQLKSSGFDVLEASSGPQALELVDQGFPGGRKVDLVLLDVMMPKMSGFEVCQKLRKRFSLTELPIIFLTAKDRPEDLVQGLAAGSNDYLTKPISKAELAARVNLHLELIGR